MIFRFVALMNILGALLATVVIVASVAIFWLLSPIPKIILFVLTLVLVMCMCVTLMILYVSIMMFIEGKKKW